MADPVSFRDDLGSETFQGPRVEASQLPEVRIEGLSKTYPNGVCALEDVSLTVGRGEFVVIVGLSGSGKSTLLRCINRLVEPTSGRIWLGEREITGASVSELQQLRRRVGF